MSTRLPTMAFYDTVVEHSNYWNAIIELFDLV